MYIRVITNTVVMTIAVAMATAVNHVIEIGNETNDHIEEGSLDVQLMTSSSPW